MSAECRPLFDQIQTYFTGEFEKIIVQGNGVSQFVHIDEHIKAKVKIPACGITELDRLSHVVYQIDSDCQIVPAGALKKIPLGELRCNEAFKGLSAEEAFDICNYVHFRPAQDKKVIELNLRREGVYNNGFLDNAANDVPKNCWTITTDTLKKTVILRNKMWPGFSAFHKYNSPAYGGVYVGTGCKALDIAFMF